MADNDIQADASGIGRHVAPSPHLSDPSITTRRIMVDVLIGLTPAILFGIYVFRLGAVKQLALCIVFCLLAEALFTAMRGRKATLGDCSAVITGAILGMSLPSTAPWFIAVIGSFVAIGLGKIVFGGLGFNIFNPAMVGRAFVMLSFAALLGAPAYIDSGNSVLAVTQATPLAAAQEALRAGGAFVPAGLWPLFLGTVNGTVGEVSALALLLGGIYLCARRSASWEIPAGTLGAVLVWSSLAWVLKLTNIGPLHHLCSGALLLGAFFIATDPVTSPLTPKGKWIFGLGVGSFVMLLRLFSSYPEGVMFAVLLMNALTPVINRYTVPRPLGGPAPQPKGA